MKCLRIIRIALAVIFLTASVICLTMVGKAQVIVMPVAGMQIVLSALSATAGATLVWLVITFLFGRIYCSTVCPVGTVSDLFLRIRNRFPALRRPFSYRHRARISIHILWIYILCVIIGIFAIPYIIEPWNIMRNLSAAVRPESVASTWSNIGFSVIFGIIAGVAAILVIAIMSLLYGRRFCTDFCPIGTGLGYISNYSIYHIEIDRDKCSSCGLCEDICRSSCIKVVSRYVDNTRCVRCLDCIAKCPDHAIRLQVNRNRPANPLMTRVKKADKA